MLAYVSKLPMIDTLLSFFDAYMQNDWQHHTNEMNMFQVESAGDAITNDVEQLLALIHDLKIQRVADVSRYYHSLTHVPEPDEASVDGQDEETNIQAVEGDEEEEEEIRYEQTSGESQAKQEDHESGTSSGNSGSSSSGSGSDSDSSDGKATTEEQEGDKTQPA